MIYLQSVNLFDYAQAELSMNDNDRRIRREDAENV